MNVGAIIHELTEIKLQLEEIKISRKDDKTSISNEHDLIVFMEKYIKNRELRKNNISSTLFINPSWDILVELFYARLIRKPEYVSSIVTAGGTPPTTGLRHLSRLQKQGFIERENQRHDRRRVKITISDDAFENMKRFFIKVSHD